MANSSDSVYEKLPENTIRVLLLEPGGPQDKLRCSFRLHEMSRSESRQHYPYEALSYVWGQLAFPQRIVCKAAEGNNGEPLWNRDRKTADIPITQNLFDALIYLRHRTKSRLLWIDAICIAQKDLAEKSHQVPLMRYIYQNAREVIIWFGLPKSSTSNALALLHNAAKWARHESGLTAPRRFDLLEETLTDSQLSHMGFPLPNNQEAWAPLIDFLHNPWFTRVWVMQEAFVARAVRMQVGHQSINFDDFGTAASFFYAKKLCVDVGIVQALIRGGITAYFSHNYSTQSRVLRVPNVLFSPLLAISRGKEASEPRDIVYALLGLVRANVRNQITVDYTKPVKLVYAEAVCYALQEMSRMPVDYPLMLLIYINHSGGIDPDWPSWLPKLDVSVTSVEDMPASPNCDYKAGGQKFIFPSIMPLDFYTLPLFGFIFTEVGKVLSFDIPYNSMAAKATVGRILQNALNIWASHPIYKDVESFEDILAQTVTEEGSLGVVGKFDRISLRKYLFDINRDPSVRTYAHENFNGVSLLPETWEEDLSAIPESEHYCQLVEDRCMNFFLESAATLCQQILFSTKDGYIALGPRISKQGDLVCILYGDQYPCILRLTEGGKFRYVGHCYIQGIMYGEALREGRTRTRVFELI